MRCRACRTTTCSTRCFGPRISCAPFTRATNPPQACAVGPGPGLLNAAPGLLTAYSINAPVLGLVGQIPHADIGRGFGHLHEMRDQAGILASLVDHTAL